MSRRPATRILRPLWALAATISLFVSARPASAQHRDILVAVRGAQLVTGSFDWGSAKAVVPIRVFQRAFEYVEQDVAAGTNPGFNAIDAPPQDFMALLEGGELTFRLDLVGSSAPFNRNLLYWEPSQSAPFGPVPNGETFQLHHRSGEVASAEGTEEAASGFVIATAAEHGVLHEHLNLILLAGGSRAPGDGSEAPTEGIYALSFVFEMDGFEPSPPAFLLMAHGEDAESSLDRAAEWIDSNLVPDCFDGRDNDLDGETDFPNDPDCESLDGASESAAGDRDAAGRDGGAGVDPDAAVVDAASATSPDALLVDAEDSAPAPLRRTEGGETSGCVISRTPVETPLGLLGAVLWLLSARWTWRRSSER